MGFRTNHSTGIALLNVSNDLLMASDRGRLSLLVLLDFSATFNTLDHRILLRRLEDVIKPFIGLNLICLTAFNLCTFTITHQHKDELLMESLKGPFLDHFALIFSCYSLLIFSESISFNCYMENAQLRVSI